MHSQEVVLLAKVMSNTGDLPSVGSGNRNLDQALTGGGKRHTGPTWCMLWE